MIIGFAALALGLALQQTDTTFDVRGASRLVLDAHDGTVIVGVWDRRQVRVQANHAQRTSVSIRQSTSGVRVEAEGYRGPARGVRFEITVPREFGVAIDGVNLAATVDGVHGDVAVDNVRGNLSASSTNQGFHITGLRGNIEAETTNGSIVMRDIQSSLVEANTINGIIEYDGTVRDDGRYYLGAFNGQITMSIPERANASIAMRTATGRIVTSFPVPLQSTRQNRISFAVGNGSARVELESHNGSIQLVRPRGR